MRRRTGLAPKKTGRRAPFSLRPTRAPAVANLVARAAAAVPPLDTEGTGTPPNPQLPTQGIGLAKMGGIHDPGRVSGRRLAVASTLFLLIVGRATVWAATECEVPAVFD